LPWIVAASTEIQQIVMNLVINAAEAVGPEGGSVHVSTGLAELSAGTDNSTQGVYIEVRDTGCGMDAATKRRIFDPFFTTKFTGRGLGLAAVSGIVLRLKGEMDVESVLGQGTTFRIVFPAVPAQIPAQVKAVAADPQSTGVILVVDDDPLIRDIVRGILEQRGYTVLHAENGKTAVAMFRANTEIIKAVLLDLTMPVMGGKEAFYLMREIQPDIPIIISTGYGDIEDRDNFSTLVSGIIQKPYTTAALVEQIAASIAHKKKPGAEVLRATSY
jgi:CheY-like chemotaxis protein